MSTILTDDEIATAIAHLYAGPEVLAMALPDELHSARAIEAAVLAKLAQQEPVAIVRRSGIEVLGEYGDLIGKNLYTHPTPQQADRQRVPTIEELTEKIASMLHGTYHCSRVWEAWNVGTMSEEDFGQVDESDTPAEIAAEIHAMLAAAPEAPAQASAVDEHDRKDAERYRFIRANGRYVVKVSGESLHCGGHLPFNADKFGPAIDKAIDEARAALAHKGGK